MKIQVFCFSNGNTAVFDKDGNQITDAQTPWIISIAENLLAAGLDPLDAEITMPNGEHVKFFKTTSGLNWKFMAK